MQQTEHSVEGGGAAGEGVGASGTNTTQAGPASTTLATELGDDNPLLEVYMNGTWVHLPVRLHSLRAALRLPQHDLFEQGIFQDCYITVSAPAGNDVPDIDHQDPTPATEGADTWYVYIIIVYCSLFSLALYSCIDYIYTTLTFVCTLLLCSYVSVGSSVLYAYINKHEFLFI